MTPGALGRADLLSLLLELADELAVRGASATVFVVGGAAMSIAFDARRSTHDIDAAFEPSREVREAAAVVAGRHNLDEGWLNDGAKGFMPGNDPGASLAVDTPSLRVELASAQYLLAMKIQAARVEQDFDDIRTLYGVLGLTTVEEGLEVASRYYGQVGMDRLLRPGSRYLLDEVVQDLRRRTVAIPPDASSGAAPTGVATTADPASTFCAGGLGPGCARGG